MMGGCLAMMGVRVGSRVAAVDVILWERVERFDARVFDIPAFLFIWIFGWIGWEDIPHVRDGRTLLDYYCDCRRVATRRFAVALITAHVLTQAFDSFSNKTR